jgi:radical SAM protein with 4Fe4S-binding SPASM domain
VSSAPRSRAPRATARISLRVGPLRILIHGITPALARELRVIVDDATDPARDAIDLVAQVCAGDAGTGVPALRGGTRRDLQAFGTPAWRFERRPHWIAEGEGTRHVRARILATSTAGRRVAERSFVRFLLSEALLASGGVALHAAAVARPRGAVVLMADSGGGKTTFARRFGDSDALADDFCLVAPSGEGFEVVPSPFPGRERLPAEGRAARLWRLAELAKARGPAFHPLGMADAVAAVLRHAIASSKGHDARGRLLDVAVRVASSVPAGRLEFGLDRDPWPALEGPATGFLGKERTARRRIERRALDLRIPLRLHLDLTWRCPWACGHCYLQDGRRLGGELDTASWVRLMREAAGLGTLFLTLSGGDPMARPDFDELLAAARGLRFAVRVKTTGWLLDRAAARRMAALGQVSVDVSLHGATARTHDAFVHRQGAFTRAKAALGHLADLGVPAKAATCAVAENINEIEDIKKTCQALGVRSGVTTVLYSGRDGGPVGRELPEGDQACVLAAELSSWQAQPPRPDDPLCKAGVSSWYVTPMGDVTPCVAWPQVVGSVRRGRLAAAIGSPAARTVARLRQRDRHDCASCELLAWCVACPGESWLESADPLAKSALACRRARVLREAHAMTGGRRA